MRVYMDASTLVDEEVLGFLKHVILFEVIQIMFGEPRIR